MNDIRGNIIMVGDTVAIASRASTRPIMEVGVVESVGERAGKPMIRYVTTHGSDPWMRPGRKGYTAMLNRVVVL